MKKIASSLIVIMLFCSGCSEEDAMTLGIVALVPAGVVGNTIESFREPVCPDGERGAVIKVLDGNKRPIKGADVNFICGSYDYFMYTDRKGEVFLRSCVDIFVISITKKGFHELELHKPIMLFELPADCKKRNKKTFLMERQPIIVQLSELGNN